MRVKSKKSLEKAIFTEIYGIHAVQAALNNKHRNNKKLVISSGLEDKFNNLKNRVAEIIVISNSQFTKIYGNKKNHQGAILETSKLKQPSIDDIIKKAQSKNTNLILMLDQVTDPQNIGSIMRSCVLFNCYSIIVSKNNAPDITSSMAKAASGALEFVNYIKVVNLSQAIKKFKKNNFWVVGFDSKVNESSCNVQLPYNCLLVFGAEGKGLRELTKKECDQILKIAMNSNKHRGIDSLNVANACTIALYEHFKINN